MLTSSLSFVPIIMATTGDSDIILTVPVYIQALPIEGGTRNVRLIFLPSMYAL